MYIGQEKKAVPDIPHHDQNVNEDKKGFFQRAWGERKEEKKEDVETERQPIEEREERECVNPISVIYKWRAREHEFYEKDQRWYIIAGLILAVIVIYAIFTDGLVMAITFILIGVVGYIVLNKEPREINFYITDDGVVADKEIYEFENIKSFWIFYETDGIKVISLHTQSKFMPFVHIPIGNEDPTKLREILLNYLKEIKQKPSAVDTFERLLGV